MRRKGGRERRVLRAFQVPRIHCSDWSIRILQKEKQRKDSPLAELDDVLETIHNLQPTGRINLTNVPSMEPPIFIDRFFGSFMVVEISRADVGTFKTYSDCVGQPKVSELRPKVNRVSKRIVNVLSSGVGKVFCSVLIRSSMSAFSLCPME